MQRRLAALARVHPDGAENMQVIRYGAQQHYHYHTDTGGRCGRGRIRIITPSSRHHHANITPTSRQHHVNITRPLR